MTGEAFDYWVDAFGDDPARHESIDADVALVTIARRVLLGVWEVRQDYVECRDGSTVALVWFADGKGRAWSGMCQSTGW